MAKPERSAAAQRVAGALARRGEPVARRRRVVAHPQHALALEHDRLGAADALQDDHARARRVERRAVAGDEPAHPLHERLLGARGEQDHADVRRPGRRAGARASSSSTATAARLSLAPGTTRRTAISPTTSAASSAATPPARRSRRRPEQRAQAGEQRAGDHELHQRRRGLLASVPVRERVGDQPRRPGVEDEPAVRRVVVGDEDHGLGRVRVAQLADDVGRDLARQRGAAEPVRAARDVVGDPGRGGQAGERRARARPRRLSPAAAPSAASMRHRHGERAAWPAPPPAAPPRPRRPARRGSTPRRAPLPGRGRRPVDRLEGLDGGEEAIAVRRRHVAGSLRGRPRP